LSVVALVLSLTGYYLTKGVRYGHGRVAQATMWEVLAAATSLTTVVLVLAAGLDGIAALPLAMGYAVFTVANWPRGRPSRAQRPALARRLRSFGLWGVIGTLAAGALLPLSQVLVRHWSDRADVALYAAAMFLATPASMLAGALAQVLFPAVARTSAGGRTDQVRQQVDLATRGLVVALVGALGAVILLAPVLLRLLYGPEYVAGRGVLSVLALAVLFTSASSGSVAGLIGGRESGMRLVATTQTAGTLTGLLVIVVASPNLGPLGSAVGVLVGSAVNGLVPVAVVWREHRMRWSSVMLRAALGLSLLGGAYAWLGESPLSAITCSVVTAAWLLTWLAVSLPDVRRLLPRS
jgi:putative peptidoglycan lipid II flippase